MKRPGSYKRQAAMILVALVACGALAATISHRGALGSAAQDRFREVPVVMVVLDELPVATLMDQSGRIDSALFPNFARLANDSTWFRNTTTPEVFTKEAVPTILKGAYPTSSDSTGEHPSLFALLEGSYDIPLTHQHDLDPSTSVTDLGKRYRDLFPGTRGEEFIRFLEAIRATDRPTFYFLHFVMPHQPWQYLPTGQTYTDGSRIPGEVNAPGKGKEWTNDAWLVKQAYQRHLLQTKLLDRQLGVLIDRLEEKGLYDRSLIVLTADHGVAFEPGASKRIVTEDTVGHIAAVPLFVKEPSQNAARISDRPLETVDIVPTMVDVLSGPHVALGGDGMSGFTEDFPEDRSRAAEGIAIDPRLTSRFRIALMKYEIFGRSRGGIDLYELGPARTRDLIGLHIGEVDVAAPDGREGRSSLSAQLDNASDVEAASPTMRLLPALLEGTLEGDGAARGELIAITLNDRIAAVTRSYRLPRRELVRFYAVLAPKWFDTPPNEIGLYLVDAATNTLTPLPVDVD